MRLDHAWIASHIPHQGAMCLIDEVLDWSANDICCRTTTHRLSSNPLRTLDALRSECGIEYAAQAVAIHAVLSGAPHRAAPAVGMLASIRDVALHVSRLDNIDTDMVIRGTRVGGNAKALMYDFLITAEAKTLLAGRVTIVLANPAAAPAGVGLYQ
jgi:predicted hotdog family 3-hydroxylacyl-ACP dehydratase